MDHNKWIRLKKIESKIKIKYWPAASPPPPEWLGRREYEMDKYMIEAECFILMNVLNM